MDMERSLRDCLGSTADLVRSWCLTEAFKIVGAKSGRKSYEVCNAGCLRGGIGSETFLWSSMDGILLVFSPSRRETLILERVEQGNAAVDELVNS